MELLTSTSAEQFRQCAEFLPLCNRGLGPLAVTVLPIPFARRAAATACAAVQSTATGPGGYSGIPKDRHPFHARRDLFEQLRPHSAA
jgi:hypothetical protein